MSRSEQEIERDRALMLQSLEEGWPWKPEVSEAFWRRVDDLADSVREIPPERLALSAIRNMHRRGGAG